MNDRLSTDMSARFNAPAQGSDDEPAPKGWRSRLRTIAGHLDPRRGDGRRGRILNLALLVAFLLVAGFTVMTVRGSDTRQVSSVQTAKVDTGSVTATVSANGNVASGSTVNLDFQGTGGIVTELLVKEGDTVKKGQVLAKVDDKSARQALTKAQAGYIAARAAYSDLVGGQTDAENAKDERSIDSVEESVDSAQTSLRHAKQDRDLTQRQQDAAVVAATANVTSAQQRLSSAQSAYASNPTSDNQSAVNSAQSSLSSAQSDLTSARNARATALLQARQAVQSADDQVDSAQANLASSKATVEVNEDDPTDGDVASARSQVVQAQVGVAEAQDDLDDKVLTATVSGTVLTINGEVGQAATSDGTRSSSSTSSSSGSSGGSSGGSSSSSSSSSSTDDSSFLTLTATDALQVTADVAEADISDVKIGDPATVTLSASSKEVAGSVTAIDSVETVTNNVVEYGVTVTLDSDTVPSGNGDDDEKIKLGQSTQVEITTDSKDGVLRVSTSALTTVGERTTATVRQASGTTRTVAVTKGLEGDGYTEVLSGLTSGQTVVIAKQADSSSGSFSFPRGGIGRGMGG